VQPTERKDGDFFANLAPRDRGVDGKQITLLALDENTVGDAGA